MGTLSLNIGSGGGYVLEGPGSGAPAVATAQASAALVLTATQTAVPGLTVPLTYASTVPVALLVVCTWDFFVLAAGGTFAIGELHVNVPGLGTGAYPFGSPQQGVMDERAWRTCVTQAYSVTLPAASSPVACSFEMRAAKFAAGGNVWAMNQHSALTIYRSMT